MNVNNPASPYVGLRPFREEDFPFFFGRDREIRVIASNLEARPLTVLYGASGVGKSSVLQAGVVRRLKDEPETSVLYFRDWQSDPLLQEIVRSVQELALPSRSGTKDRAQELSGFVTRRSERVFLLLDQFEEFLLYHAADELGEAFDSVLARIVNRKDCPVNVLIGIRDDSLFKLDRRFSIRIPNLLRDTLEVERLAPAGAKSAIEKPLKVFTERSGNGKVYDIEPALVDEVLQQVQTGQVAISESSGTGTTRARPSENRIETAYLQLVLTKLWEEEKRRNSTTLRVQTLNELGGADNIVRSHVNAVMNQLASNRERDIAANMFRYLVTPSRSKIAQATKDLVSYAERPEVEVKRVLDELTDRSESRILRRLSDPEQYEIFHDVLAQPLLDWRHAYGEKLETKRLRRFIAGAVTVAILFALLAAYALFERHQAKDAANVALVSSLKVQVAEKQAQEALAQLKADKAALAGHEAEADRLRSQAAEFASQAASISQSYRYQQQALDSTSKQALTSVQAANQERDVALQNLATMQKQRDDYKSQLEGAQELIKKLQGANASSSQAQGHADVGPAQRKTAQGPAQEATSNSSSAPAPPTGLTAMVNGRSHGVSGAVSTPLTIAAGTEICAVPGVNISAKKKMPKQIWVMVTEPQELFGILLLGKLERPVPSVQGSKGVQNLPAPRLEFDTLVRSFFLEQRTPITAELRSVKSSDQKHQFVVDTTGSISGLQNASIPKGSELCIVITKTVSVP